MMRLNADFLTSSGPRLSLASAKFCIARKKLNVEKLINCFNPVSNTCIIAYGISYNKKLCLSRISHHILTNLAKHFIKLRVSYADQTS